MNNLNYLDKLTGSDRLSFLRRKKNEIENNSKILLEKVTKLQEQHNENLSKIQSYQNKHEVFTTILNKKQNEIQIQKQQLDNIRTKLWAQRQEFINEAHLFTEKFNAQSILQKLKTQQAMDKKL